VAVLDKRQLSRAETSKGKKLCSDHQNFWRKMAKDALTALQMHFEEQYGKLDMTGAKGKKRKRTNPEEKEEKTAGGDSEEEWRGIQDGSNDEEIQPEPQLVVFTGGEDLNDALDVRSSSFMVLALFYLLTKSSKIPKSATAKKASQVSRTESSDEETENLKNDVALQRLLRESNILSEHASRGDPGRLHHLTLDSRISHLGGKDTSKGRIPTKIRQGIEAAKQKRQAKREREAKEAGILMPVKRKVKSEVPRQRGLNTASGVGKFKNGMLKINERDIRRINSSGSQGQRRGKSVKKLFK